MDKKNISDLETLLQEILIDAYNDEEQMWAVQQYIEDQLAFPVDGFVVGEPITVLVIDYSGNIRQGLMASCRKENGEHYKIAAADIVFPPDAKGSIVMAVYRYWLGLEPFPESSSVQTRDKHHKATEDEIDMSRPVKLIVVSVKEKACRCLIPETKRSITLRTGSLNQAVPGWIVTVDPGKQWRFSGHPYLSGKITGVHLDAYAHLGNMEFDSFPESAIKNFEAGVRIGELSLEENFIGLLPWSSEE